MPSGTQYVYASLASGESTIWLRSVTDGWARPLVRGKVEGDTILRMHPRSSPDGQRISYIAYHPSLIWVVPAAGGTPVRLDPGSTAQSAHSWSPDGNWIAYSCRRGSSLEIAKISSGGGGTAVTLKSGLKSPTPIVWSPTGDWISYVDADGVHLMNAAGGSHRLLTADPALYWEFAKDGKSLHVIRNSTSRRLELVTYDVGTGQRKTTRTLDLPMGRVSGLSLHPDGRRFLTSVIRFEYDIWLIEGLLRPPAYLTKKE
jgi:WD40 repeat protein